MKNPMFALLSTKATNGVVATNVSESDIPNYAGSYLKRIPMNEFKTNHNYNIDLWNELSFYPDFL